MDKLPPEVLERILRYYEKSSKSARHYKVWPTGKKHVIHAKAAAERRITLSALARSSKSLCKVVTPFLYGKIYLDTQLRSNRFMRTYTGHINPWSKERKRIVGNKCDPTSICIDFSAKNESTALRKHPLPNLSLLRDLGHFSHLTILRLHNCHDPRGNLAELLKPFSILRTQLTEVDIVHAFDFGEDQTAASFSLGFIFEMGLYLPDVCFVFKAMCQLEEAHARAYEHDDRLGRGVSRQLRMKCRTDFTFFCSLIDWPEAFNHWEIDPQLVDNPWSPPSPFSALTSLHLTISEPLPIFLLFNTPVVIDLQRLKLSGWTFMDEQMVITLRRSISREDESKPGRCKSPLDVRFQDGYETTELYYFLLHHKRNPQLGWYELDDDGWDHIDYYMGPELDLLDLRDLRITACEHMWD